MTALVTLVPGVPFTYTGIRLVTNGMVRAAGWLNLADYHSDDLALDNFGTLHHAQTDY